MVSSKLLDSVMMPELILQAYFPGVMLYTSTLDTFCFPMISTSSMSERDTESTFTSKETSLSFT